MISISINFLTMSYGSTQINHNDNKQTSGQHKLPRYFTAEGRARIAEIQHKTKITPHEDYMGTTYVVVVGGCNSCGTIDNNASYSYQAGRRGGSPF